MENLNVEVEVSIIAKINLLDVAQRSNVDENELVEIIESNDPDRISQFMQSLPHNFARIFQNQNDYHLLSPDINREVISIRVGDEVITNNLEE